MWLKRVSTCFRKTHFQVLFNHHPRERPTWCGSLTHKCFFLHVLFQWTLTSHCTISMKIWKFKSSLFLQNKILRLFGNKSTVYALIINKELFFFFLFFYSYLHTMFGSFLPPSPTLTLTRPPSPPFPPDPLATHQKLFCPYL
jgi:hypothetical protein